MRYLKLITPPATEPLDLTRTKVNHLRVDTSDDDQFITDLITAARQHVERVTERAMITQTWDMIFDAFPTDPANYIELPLSPLQSVTSITYTDSGGTPTVWTSTNYLVDDATEPPRIKPAFNQTWPSATLRPMNAVAIRFVAGYGAASAVPWTLKQAMTLLVGHWYENREATAGGSNLPRAIEFAVDALLSTYKARAVA